MTGVKWVHIPYKGGALALIDLVGGQISISFGNIPTVIQQVRAGFLKSGADPSETTIEQYNAFIQREFATWTKVIKAAGIQGE